jgi:organic radical activating enzyme
MPSLMRYLIRLRTYFVLGGIILDKIKTRIFKDKNYKGIYFNGKTIRLALDNKKPIKELDYPEFYDLKITGHCKGKCKFCYQDSTEKGMHYDVIPKIKSFFGKLTENQKPLQISIGGGEPTSHPDFIEILKCLYEMEITPNYTTNGMHLTKEIIDATKKYCGGVAISTHPHLEKYWMRAVVKFYQTKINLHHIISDKESIDSFLSIWERYHRIVDYIVLLPYIAQGRADKKEIDYNYLEDVLDNMPREQIAFGAYFYDFLKDKTKYDISLYEPELLSKYLDCKDMKIYKSSFDCN